MANTITNLIQPVGKTKVVTVSTASTSSSVTVSDPGTLIGGVLITNLTTGNPVYASLSAASGSVTAPTTTGQFVVPVLGLTQATVANTVNPMTATIFVNLIAAGSGSVAITPLA